MSKKGRGVLTMAYGKEKYIRMAINLARSLNIKNPDIKKAIVTDSSDQELYRLFDVVIPMTPSFGDGFRQKVKMYHYSPFEETIFIDSDCLVIDDITFLFHAFSANQVGVIGTPRKDGMWPRVLATDIPSFLAKNNLEYLPVFNGGVYYFKKSEKAQNIFDFAYSLFDTYHELSFLDHGLGSNEEPVMAYSMAKFQEKPFEDRERKSMYTPIGIKGSIEIDVFKGYCSFIKNQKRVAPVIVHFPGNFSNSFFYKREILKLKIHSFLKGNQRSISSIVNFAGNSYYVCYIFLYRIYLSIFRNRKCRFFPLMPILKKYACSK